MEEKNFKTGFVIRNQYFKEKKKILVHCPTAVIQEYKDKIIQTVDELYKNDESVEVYFCNDSLEGKQNLNEMVGAYMGKNKKIYSYEDPLILFASEEDGFYYYTEASCWNFFCYFREGGNFIPHTSGKNDKILSTDRVSRKEYSSV